MEACAIPTHPFTQPGMHQWCSPTTPACLQMQASWRALACHLSCPFPRAHPRRPSPLPHPHPHPYLPRWFVRPAQLKACENLPTKLELITTVALLAKQPATKIATGIKAVSTKLATAVKKVSELDEDTSKIVGDLAKA
eukprot:335102-Chlamydomonas_euryale.AAC.6